MDPHDILFSVYINGRSTNRSCRSLQEAMIMAISYENGHERSSPGGGTYFVMKMLAREPGR
jgi:hypothetical protein